MTVNFQERLDRRNRLQLQYVTNDEALFGKKVKCFGGNMLGDDIKYAVIPGKMLVY